MVKEGITLSKGKDYPYVFINGKLPDRVIKTLDDELSYFVEGYERTTAYKNQTWDGRETLLYRTRNRGLFFPNGLLNRVISVLVAFGVKYSIEDKTPMLLSRPLNLKWISNIKLRDYQATAIGKLIANKGGVLSLPTGAGKTVTAIGAIVGYSLPTLIIVHRKDLLYQWRNEIKKHIGYDVGLVGDGNKEFKQITVGMMQSISQMIKKRKIDSLEFQVIIIDEAHRAPADSCYFIAMRCNAPVRIGLSATPRRTDGADLKIWACVGEICMDITPVELIKKGYLAKPTFKFIDVPWTLVRGSRNWHDVYRDGIVTNIERNEIIAKIANKLVLEGHKVYIHVEMVDHGEILEGMIASSEFVYGKDKKKKRDDIIGRFKEGDLRCLISTLLAEGSDIPSITAIIMAGGLKSVVGTIQKIGRVLRVKKDKSEAIIIDFKDNGRFLSDHWQERYASYCEYYGEYVG